MTSIIQILCGLILIASCSRETETASDTEDRTGHGRYASGQCEVHHRDFLEEKVASSSGIPPNLPSVSEEYDRAERTLHPNHNSWPNAYHSDTKIKWVIRRYCPDCRESLKTWIDNQQEAEQDGEVEKAF